MALSSLGAVGGARGTAAGGLRILVEFFTQYDPAAVKQLEADLANLEQIEQSQNAKSASLEQQASNRRIKIAQAEALVKAKIVDRGAKAQFRQAQNLRKTGSAADVRTAISLEKLALNKSDLTAKEEKIIRAAVGHRTRLRNLEAQQERIAKARLATEEQIAATSGSLAQQRGIKSGVIPKLGGLAIGAIGGIVGGAVLGVGFAAAQAGLELLGEGLQNILDPARKAREVLSDVASAINKLIEASDGLTDEEVISSYLKSLGLQADDDTVTLLKQAAAAQRAQERVDQYMQTGLVASQATALFDEQVKRLAKQFESEARAAYVAENATGGLIDRQTAAQISMDAMGRAARFLADGETIAADEADRLAAKTAALARNLEAVAILARYAAEALDQAISAGAQAAFINPIDQQIESLQESGPSAKTQALQAKIEQLQSSGDGGSQKNSELANIAEERALILLRMRLRMMGTEIDLSKFAGKFLLEAINAKITALDKQAAAQDRVNRLLDLQFRMSQTIRRNEGESINDFMERRAQENRNLLSEQRDLENERIKESLQEQQEKVQDEVALAELSERQKNAAAKGGSDNRLKLLQKELEASQKADAAALKAKLAALEKQRQAYQKSADDAAYYASVAANDEIREAARAANSVSRIAALSGKSRGLSAAKSFLEALLQSGVLSSSEAADVIAAINRINKTLSLVGDAQYAVMKNTLVKPGSAPTPFASGGFIPLNAGSTPFGRNARFGEHGTEGGMFVLSTQMMNKMKGSNSGGPFRDLIINRSDDPQADYYRTKRMVRDVVREEIGK